MEIQSNVHGFKEKAVVLIAFFYIINGLPPYSQMRALSIYMKRYSWLVDLTGMKWSGKFYNPIQYRFYVWEGEGIVKYMNEGNL
jgi:hypothetical protein